jgi:hypothetical protein
VDLPNLEWSNLLLNPPNNQENAQASTARRAAEALFTPKQDAQSLEPDSVATRKSRILAALAPVKLEVTSAAEKPKPESYHAMPKSQIGRLRTWLKYGMTLRQAADAWGVSVSELKHAIRPVLKVGDE